MKNNGGFATITTIILVMIAAGGAFLATNSFKADTNLSDGQENGIIGIIDNAEQVADTVSERTDQSIIEAPTSNQIESQIQTQSQTQTQPTRIDQDTDQPFINSIKPQDNAIELEDGKGFYVGSIFNLIGNNIMGGHGEQYVVIENSNGVTGYLNNYSVYDNQPETSYTHLRVAIDPEVCINPMSDLGICRGYISLSPGDYKVYMLVGGPDGSKKSNAVDLKIRYDSYKIPEIYSVTPSIIKIGEQFIIKGKNLVDNRGDQSVVFDLFDNDGFTKKFPLKIEDVERGLKNSNGETEWTLTVSTGPELCPHAIGGSGLCTKDLVKLTPGHRNISVFHDNTQGEFESNKYLVEFVE